jgi:NADH-quinone oxidoreductase subunit C
MNNTIQDIIAHFDLDAVSVTESPHKTGISLEITKNELIPIIEYTLNHTEYNHLITITCIDHGMLLPLVELCYHLTNGPFIITLRTKLTYNDLIITTITDLAPGASLYEREIHDLFGVIFEGHPNLTPLLLPDNWPKNIHPLRKEWTVEKIRSTVDKTDQDGS